MRVYIGYQLVAFRDGEGCKLVQVTGYRLPTTVVVVKGYQLVSLDDSSVYKPAVFDDYQLVMVDEGVDYQLEGCDEDTGIS